MEKKKVMMRFLLLVFICFIVMMTSTIKEGRAGDRYHFINTQQHQEFNELIQNMRCLVCQNETLAASNATLAQDLRAKIYVMVKQGASKDTIVKYFVDRYGDFILYKPPVTVRTYALWFGPFLLLLIGLGILWRVILKNKTPQHVFSNAPETPREVG